MNKSFVPIHKSISIQIKFPMQKLVIFCKVKEIKELRGGVQHVRPQAIPQIDAEIAKKGNFWMDTTTKAEPVDPAFVVWWFLGLII